MISKNDILTLLYFIYILLKHLIMEPYSNTHIDNMFNGFDDSSLEVIQSIMDYTKVMGSSLLPGDNDYLTKTNEQIYEYLMNPTREEYEEYDDLTDPSAYLDKIYEDSLDDDEDYSSDDENNTISDTESEGDDWVTM